MNGYRRRIFNEIAGVLSTLAPLNAIIDVGAGDGWFANQIAMLGICSDIKAVDVKARPRPHHPVQIYDGDRLPFADASFDLTYAIDVVHHAPEPVKLLTEMIRITRRFLMLKDHTWHTKLGWLILAVRDEMGNRPYGVRSPHRFQRDWEWDSIIRANSMEPVRLMYPLACHLGPLGPLANRNEFLSVWRSPSVDGCR